MKKLKRIFLTITLLIFVSTLFTNQKVFGINAGDIGRVEYSEEFQEWLKLSDEEKEKVIMPRPYNIKFSRTVSKNPLYSAMKLKASLDTRYSLKDIIPTNLTIKDQMQTGSCWAFAAVSSLETNLAVANYKNGNLQITPYDFSERHMEYFSSKTFANNVEHKLGYNREVGSGGGYYLAESYLTNGSGAISEDEMPFENNENRISINEIQGKTVVSQVYDTILFANYNKATGETKTEIMNQIKQHIQNNGSVFASIHGANLNGSCYNNNTGAQYCDDSTDSSGKSLHPVNHAVSIIGWDDEYIIDNFAENAEPTSKGAWIVRNSWGEKLEDSLSGLKETLFEEYGSQFIQAGWNSAEEIPNSFIEQMGYTIEGDRAYMKIGDNGIIYVSYEDVNIASGLWGIEKASDTIDYDNIYQYDDYYPIGYLPFNNPSAILCNIFNKKTDGTEYLNQVAINLLETSTCKVYVNPNGTSRNKADLKEVELKAGETEILEAGYHTLEFANPIEIKAESFVVAIEVQSTGSTITVPIESKLDGLETFNSVIVENGKCFIGLENSSGEYEWLDLSELTDINSELSNGDSTIKAFTTNGKSGALESIEIETPPNKTVYRPGENFDKTGMVVKAKYDRETDPYVVLDDSSYSITNGTNLVEGQNSVTITFGGKSVEQQITVKNRSVESLTIKTPPNKTEYKEGQNFDKTGMVVEATFDDGGTEIVQDYTITNGNNVKADQTYVTILYGEETVNQPITVTANPLIEINITKAPNKTKYIVGQNFDKEGMVVVGRFQDGDIQEIIEYNILNGTNLTKEQATVTIEYEGKTAEQEITVEEKNAIKIAISKNPNKMQYIQNKEQLDLTGGTIKVDYNDGSSEEISLESDQVSVTGFNNKNVGKNTLTVKYQNQTTTFDVQIVEAQIPKNSNFDAANCNISSSKYFTFSNKNTQPYFVLESVISGMTKATGNDSYEYYYYLSLNQAESSIQDWVKISENQTADNKLQFKINTKDVKNFAEISNNDTIYVYIKEVVTKGGDQSVLVSKAIKMNNDTTPEVYLDNLIAYEGNNNNNPGNNGEQNNGDGTTTTKVIPNAGTTGILIVIAIISVAAAIAYIRYRHLNKYIK